MTRSGGLGQEQNLTMARAFAEPVRIALLKLRAFTTRSFFLILQSSLSSDVSSDTRVLLITFLGEPGHRIELDSVFFLVG